jgi:hypothetical protein
MTRGREETSIMSNAATTTDQNTAEEKTDAAATSVVDAVFDAALAWIDVGLGQAKLALEGSSRAMERTAKTLEVVREKLAR